MMSKEATIELKITALAFGGDGLGREQVGDAQGRVVFVPGVLPGERVRIAFTQQKKDFARGRVVEWLEQSPERIEPPCPIAEQCGGCPWQHGSRAVQEASKTEIVRTAIERLCRNAEQTPPELSPMVSAEPLGYRNRIRVKVVKKKKAMTIGFYGKGSRDLVDVPSCSVAHEDVNRGLQILRKTLALHLEEGEGSAVVSASEGAGIVVSLRLRSGDGTGLAGKLVEDGLSGASVHWKLGKEEAGEPWVEWPLGGEPASAVKIRAGGFAQGNPQVFRSLLDDLRQAVSDMEPSPRRLVDLFAGAGTLSVPLSPLVEELVAVEGNTGAVEDLMANANRLGRKNIRAHEMDLREPDLLVEMVDGEVDVVVLDPPREGAKTAMDSIVDLAPRRILYVSCDPITQTRDLAMLLARGYGLSRLKLYDMFPQTPHLETLAILDRMPESSAD